jgi:hypothetical protein
VSAEAAVSGAPSLYFEYLRVYFDEPLPELIAGVPILHLAPLMDLVKTVYTFTIRRDSDDGAEFERQVVFNASSQGCAFTVGDVGNYSVAFESVSPPLSGQLGHGDAITSFSVTDEADNIYWTVPYWFATESPAATATPPQSPTATQNISLTATQNTSPTASQTTSPTASQNTSPTSAPGPTVTSGSQTTPTSTPAISVTPDDSQSSGLGAGPIAGIAIGSVVLVALVAVGIVCACRRKRRTGVQYESLIDSVAEDPPYK